MSRQVSEVQSATEAESGTSDAEVQGGSARKQSPKAKASLKGSKGLNRSERSSVDVGQDKAPAHESALGSLKKNLSSQAASSFTEVEAVQPKKAPRSPPSSREKHG